MAKKKNFRKIPGKIQAKLNSLPGDFVEAGVTLRYTKDSVARGALSNLGIEIIDGDIYIPTSVLPQERNGKTSKINIQGKEIVRKDLPMTTKTYSADLPSWGSTTHTHTVYWDRDVYQRDYIPPANMKIEAKLLNTEHGDTTAYIIKFRVDESFFKGDLDFSTDFLFALNLLQENLGFSNAYEADATDEDYLSTEFLDWEIFPPGQRDDLFTKFASNKRKVTGSTMSRIEERYNFLLGFKPTAFIRGSNRFKNYFGAKFGENLVVFENIDYGNAIYILEEEWEELSKLSRVELLKKYREKFKRIVHTEGWKQRLSITLKNLQGGEQEEPEV